MTNEDALKLLDILNNNNKDNSFIELFDLFVEKKKETEEGGDT